MHVISKKIMTKQRTKTRPNELDGYWELIHGFPLRPIRTEKELDRAIEVIDALLDRADLTAAEEDYLDLLGDLVEQYEDEAHPLPDVSDGAMLRFLIDQKDVVQADVAGPRASLNRGSLKCCPASGS